MCYFYREWAYDVVNLTIKGENVGIDLFGYIKPKDKGELGSHERALIGGTKDQ